LTRSPLVRASGMTIPRHLCRTKLSTLSFSVITCIFSIAFVFPERIPVIPRTFHSLFNSSVSAITSPKNRSGIPLLLSRSPQFACICLFYCLIYGLSFVFRTSWRQNLLSLRFLGDCACFFCSFDRPKMVILYCLTIPIKCAMFLSNSNLPFPLFSSVSPSCYFFLTSGRPQFPLTMR